MQAIHSPQRPAMRPDGIGRSGSFIASTWRSNQSLTAWLVPHTKGPVSAMPAITKAQRPLGELPEETIPHPNAQIGGNQVIGLSSSSTSAGLGRGAGTGADTG